MRWAILFTFACIVGCGWPATRMEPVADYGARHTATVSSAPLYTAGPSTRRTYSPDGATLFVCDGGETAHGASVTPGARPAC
jgi:hypothetical protein